MEMTDMKMSKAEKKMMSPVTMESSGPDYPWGLSLNLDSKALDKLGIKELPEVGEEVMVHAVGKVIRVSSSASDKSEDRSVEIQITRLSLMSEEGMWAQAKRDRKARY